VSEFLQRVESEIRSRRLLSRGQKILAAVSGGVDSMVLLHVLHSLARKNHWQISVAHFNHQLRGRASDADEKLVRQTAKKMRREFYPGRADAKKIAAQSKISVEMAARKLRHEFLARVTREQKIPVVALAHHADDQVELFFLRLLRGAGGEGLAGMKWRSPSPADKKIALVRPLLGFSKAEVLVFARANKISFRDDATNLTSDFLRNRIRNELLPLLRKKYQPGLTRAVLRLMEIVGAEAEFAGATAQAFLQKMRSRRGDEVQTEIGNRKSEIAIKSEFPYVVVGCFDDLPLAVQRKALQLQLNEAGVVADFELVERLREAPTKFVSVGANVSVARSETGKIELRIQSVAEFNSGELKLKFSGRATRAEFGGRKFYWQIMANEKFQLPKKKFTGGTPVPLQQTEFFDADKIGGEITLRHWRAGDRFQPIGLKSPVKLQDLFVNAKIPAVRRRELVLATTARGEIFWVEGLRIGGQFKLLPETRRKLVWNWSKFPV